MTSYQRWADDNRKDARVSLKDRQIRANCETLECKFNALIKNVSASGVFIETEESLKKGQEIAMIFRFSKSGKKVMATGEVTRTDNSGAGVEIKILFKSD